MKPSSALAALAATLAASCTSPRVSDSDAAIRIATFNASLYRDARGDLAADLAAGDEQARQVAQIVQVVRPDILVLQEFDWDPSGEALRRFREDFLGQGISDLAPIHFDHVFTAEVNTGAPSGRDLDGNGEVGGPGDCWGYGTHHGQYGMLVLSRFPIGEARTFRLLRWSEMPDHVMPPDFLSDDATQAMRLSSKSHWDLPVSTPGGGVVHLLVSHPTPPVFDGPEDRNGRRNHDEIRFWADYVSTGNSDWIRDDAGRSGGLPAGSHFVVCGDQNADPKDGDSFRDAALQLVDHPDIDDSRTPFSHGAVQAALEDGGANRRHLGASRFDTGDFGDDPGPGNLRLDYVLPSRSLLTIGSGVFWPMAYEPYSELVACSDHRLVWIDIAIP